jgi:hypothetical protein
MQYRFFTPLAFLFLGTSLSAQTVLSDSDFTGWGSWGYQSNWGWYASTQDLTDGTPAPCYQVTSGATYVDDVQNIFHYGSPHLDWDPSTMGPISDISVSFQLSTLSPTWWTRARVYVYQAGYYFTSTQVWGIDSAPTAWHEVTPFIHLREADFISHWGLNGVTHGWNPDFSASGAPISIGFYHESDWLQVGDSYEFKIDDLEVTVRTPSDPPHLAVRTPHFDGPLKMSVTGLATGTHVQFGASLAGFGAGPCYPQWGNVCVDILAPVTYLGTGIAYPAADGEAATIVDIPSTLAVGTTIYLQAVIVDGPGGSTSYTTNTQEVIVSG